MSLCTYIRRLTHDDYSKDILTGYTPLSSLFRARGQIIERIVAIKGPVPFRIDFDSRIYESDDNGLFVFSDKLLINYDRHKRSWDAEGRYVYISNIAVHIPECYKRKGGKELVDAIRDQFEIFCQCPTEMLLPDSVPTTEFYGLKVSPFSRIECNYIEK